MRRAVSPDHVLVQRTLRSTRVVSSSVIFFLRDNLSFRLAGICQQLRAFGSAAAIRRARCLSRASSAACSSLPDQRRSFSCPLFSLASACVAVAEDVPAGTSVSAWASTPASLCWAVSASGSIVGSTAFSSGLLGLRFAAAFASGHQPQFCGLPRLTFGLSLGFGCGGLLLAAQLGRQQQA